MTQGDSRANNWADNQRAWAAPTRLAGVLTTVDHKVIGKRYITTSFIFLLLGGVQVMLMRAQLAVPENALVTPEVYNQLFTMHGTTMIFFFATPILFGFGNYLLPLMIGALTWPISGCTFR